MRYMLLQAYGGVELEGCVPMTEWAPKDVRAHIDFQHALNAELLDSGELVDAQGLAGPDVAKFVVSDGVNPPKIIDGPYPESKELLAGYRLVDVDASTALSRSPRARRPHPARAVCRSSSGSRCAR
jgi:hypothetical protein